MVHIIRCLDCGNIHEQNHRSAGDSCVSCGSRRVVDYCRHPDAEWDEPTLYSDGTGAYEQGHCPDCKANLERMYSFIGIRDVDNDIVLTSEGEMA